MAKTVLIFVVSFASMSPIGQHPDIYLVVCVFQVFFLTLAELLPGEEIRQWKRRGLSPEETEE